MDLNIHLIIRAMTVSNMRNDRSQRPNCREELSVRAHGHPRVEGSLMSPCQNEDLVFILKVKQISVFLLDVFSDFLTQQVSINICPEAEWAGTFSRV